MIAGAILGLLGSVLPEAIKLFKDWQDKKHEAKMLELQLRYQKEMAQIRIAEAAAHAELELDKATYKFAEPKSPKLTGSKFLDFLQIIANVCNQLVRPTLTFMVITFGWLGVKYAMWKTMGGTLEVYPQIWTGADYEFVGAVFGFWFGGRSLRHAMRRYIDG